MNGQLNHKDDEHHNEDSSQPVIDLLDAFCGDGPQLCDEWLSFYESEDSAFSVSGRYVSVPEPGTLTLFGIGLFGMGLTRRKKKV